MKSRLPPEGGIRLASSDLLLKGGFIDGEAVNLWSDRDPEAEKLLSVIDARMRETDQAAGLDPDDRVMNGGTLVLVVLIRRHLLPLIPDTPVFAIDSAHNPVRAEREPPTVFVLVTDDDVRSAIADTDRSLASGLSVGRLMGEEGEENSAPSPSM